MKTTALVSSKPNEYYALCVIAQVQHRFLSLSSKHHSVYLLSLLNDR